MFTLGAPGTRRCLRDIVYKLIELRENVTTEQMLVMVMCMLDLAAEVEDLKVEVSRLKGSK